jgi:hypothetical protein
MGVDRSWISWGLLGLVAGICWVSLEAQKPPPARPVDAPTEEFSAYRAMRHVRAIARVPHPTASPESEKVRTTILKALADLGLKAEVQKPRDPKSPLRNIVARRRGTGSEGKKALLLCAHYDSVDSGPGAGDDASGVAVVLETLRAIENGPPIDRDIIALIDDGEEQGLLGAKLFVDEHPSIKDVGVVLNFDAGGISGPSFMFETSEENGWLIRQFALASPQPLAMSMSMDVYRIMPNSSDLTIFKRAGLAGLNFVFAGGRYAYHAEQDNPANLDPRSVQAQGDNALAMTRRLGNLDLDSPKAANVIYTSILGRWVVSYPESWATPIAALVVASLLGAVGIGLRNRRVTIFDLGVGIWAWLVAALGAIFGATAFWIVLREMLHGVGVYWFREIEIPIMILLSTVAAAIFLNVERRAARSRPVEALALGAVGWWVAFTVGATAWFPNSSYLFAWPAFFVLIGMGAAMLVRRGSAAGLAMTLVGTLPLLILFTPIYRNGLDGLGLRTASLVMVLVALFLGAILPLLTPILIGPGHPNRDPARTCPR